MVLVLITKKDSWGFCFAICFYANYRCDHCRWAAFRLSEILRRNLCGKKSLWDILMRRRQKHLCSVFFHKRPHADVRQSRHAGWCGILSSPHAFGVWQQVLRWVCPWSLVQRKRAYRKQALWEQDNGTDLRVHGQMSCKLEVVSQGGCDGTVKKHPVCRNWVRRMRSCCRKTAWKYWNYSARSDCGHCGLRYSRRFVPGRCPTAAGKAQLGEYPADVKKPGRVCTADESFHLFWMSAYWFQQPSVFKTSEKAAWPLKRRQQNQYVLLPTRTAWQIWLYIRSWLFFVWKSCAKTARRHPALTFHAVQGHE